MIYLKARIVQRYPPMCEWGGAIRYLEIGDDHYANRQVDIFENGNSLRYDRERWSDNCDSIGGMKYDAVKWLKWWGPDEKIAATEFETAWSLAEMAPNQPQAYCCDAGTWPMLLAEQKRRQRNADT